MDPELQKYYKPSIYFSSSIGLWPFGNATLKKCQNIFFLTLLIVGVILQVVACVTKKYTLTLLLTNLSTILMTLPAVVKYIAFWYQTETIKGTIERIESDWKTTAKEERIIIEEHAREGRYYTIFFASFISPSVIGLIISQFTSQLLDVVAPLNVTRTRKLAVMAEFIFDEQKYFYFIALYIDVTLITISLTFIATETACIMWVQHASGLFEIVCCRIRLAVRGAAKSKKDLVSAVHMHRNSMEFMQKLQSDFMLSYLIVLMLGVLSLSINLFRVSQALLVPNGILELLTSASFVVSVLGYMYFMNYMAQRLLDCSNSIFTTLYDVEWYETSVHTQQLLLYMMMKSAEVCSFELCGLFSPSIEGFSKLARMSTSYFMVIHSVQ